LLHRPHLRLGGAKGGQSLFPLFRGRPIPDSEKRGRGRPRTGVGRTIGLRLYGEEQAALAAWTASQPDPKPSKPEAIRKLLNKALESSEVRSS
jgi:hypothetical protein